MFNCSTRRCIHACLLDRARLPEGPIARSWDGRGDDGLEAPPGLYLARLDTAVGRVTRILVKLR